MTSGHRSALLTNIGERVSPGGVQAPLLPKI